MNQKTMIKGKIHYVGVNDRNKHLFEGLWPLPYGVYFSFYHSLLVHKTSLFRLILHSNSRKNKFFFSHIIFLSLISSELTHFFLYSMIKFIIFQSPVGCY